jgi:hypothetical protein
MPRNLVALDGAIPIRIINCELRKNARNLDELLLAQRTVATGIVQLHRLDGGVFDVDFRRLEAVRGSGTSDHRSGECNQIN